MSKRNKRFYDNFTPQDRKDQDDAVAAFIAEGGAVTQLKEGKGTSNYAFKKMEDNGIDDNAGRTGGVALFGRVERNTVAPKD